MSACNDTAEEKWASRSQKQNVTEKKINVRWSAEICLPQTLSVRIKHALHFVQNLNIPKSVAQNFDRYGICMKYQIR